MGLALVCECNRIDCDNEAVVEIEHFDTSQTVRELLPEGWGFQWISTGVDKALRCPEHRNDEPVERLHD